MFGSLQDLCSSAERTLALSVKMTFSRSERRESSTVLYDGRINAKSCRWSIDGSIGVNMVVLRVFIIHVFFKMFLGYCDIATCC